IDQFIDLLHGVKAQGQVVLLAVPGAAILRAQSGHHVQDLVDSSGVFHKITKSSRCTASVRGNWRARISVEPNLQMPRANSVPFKSQIRTISPSLKSPSQRAMPGGNRLLPASRNAFLAPSSTNNAPLG